MEQNLYEKLTALKEGIAKDPRVIKLNELDQKLSSDEEAMKLSYQKDLMSTYYEDAIKHFGEESKEAKEAQKKLYEAKYKLDSLQIVKEYNKAYQEVRLLYQDKRKGFFRL